MLYNGNDDGGFLRSKYISDSANPPNLCRIQLAHMGNSIDHRDNKFINGYVLEPF